MLGIPHIIPTYIHELSVWASAQCTMRIGNWIHFPTVVNLLRRAYFIMIFFFTLRVMPHGRYGWFASWYLRDTTYKSDKMPLDALKLRATTERMHNGLGARIRSGHGCCDATPEPLPQRLRCLCLCGTQCVEMSVAPSQRTGDADVRVALLLARGSLLGWY